MGLSSHPTGRTTQIVTGCSEELFELESADERPVGFTKSVLKRRDSWLITLLRVGRNSLPGALK